MSRFHLIAFALFISAGCSTSHGLHLESLEERLRQDALSFEGTPDQDARAGRMPPTVALYLKPTGFLGRSFEWDDKDRDLVLTWAKKLASTKVLAGARFVSPASLKGNSLVELRQAAERYGANAVLVLDGAAEVDHYNNYKGFLLYWTIVGAYVADGTHSDALCVIQASMWDVKTGSRLFSETGKGNANLVGPAALVDDNVVVKEAKAKALEEL